MNKWITTTIKGRLIGALLDEKNQLIEVYPFSEKEQSNIGTIYVGRVQTIKKNIEAAFIDIGEENIFISLKESKHFFYAKKNGKKEMLVQGDEIIVQIQKDAHKTKLAKGVTDFCLTGKYLVLTTDQSTICLSSKITDITTRRRLKKLVKNMADPAIGFIIRTNSQAVEEDVILSELDTLTKQYQTLLSKLSYRQKGQVLVTQESDYISILKNMYEDQVSSYLYDDQDIYNQVVSYATISMPSILEKLQWINEDSTLGMTLSLDHKIQKLLRKKVWLPSGGSIIIEPTEALTVIDVNTEKTISKKKVDLTIYKTNLEAAKVLMHQIRARNISGIIIVDFIDMYEEEKKHALVRFLRELAKEDPMKTIILGMTRLSLIEITRKKSRVPLADAWQKD